MNFSNHVLQRYAERISKKATPQEIAQYIDQYEDKVKEDIEKMLVYGTCVYEGESTKQKGHTVQIFVKDSWVVIYDPEYETVVTLYQIDLGVSKTCNDMYITEVLEKIKECENRYRSAVAESETEKKTYIEAIADNKAQIADYKSRIRELETQNEAYQTLYNTLTTKTRKSMDDWKNATMMLTSYQIF